VHKAQHAVLRQLQDDDACDGRCMQDSMRTLVTDEFISAAASRADALAPAATTSPGAICCGGGSSSAGAMCVARCLLGSLELRMLLLLLIWLRSLAT